MPFIVSVCLFSLWLKMDALTRSNLQCDVEKLGLLQDLSADIIERHVRSWRVTYQKLVQVTLRHVLEQHAHGFACQHHAEEADDVRMPQISH